MLKRSCAAAVIALVLPVGVAADDKLRLDVDGRLSWVSVVATQTNHWGEARNNLDTIGDAEVYFNLRTPDFVEGWSAAARVELEAGTLSEDDPIDRAYMHVTSPYGRLTLGVVPNAARIAHVVPGAAGPVLMEFSVLNRFIIPPAPGVTFPNATEPRFDVEATKISYFTPRFMGWQAGASYIPGAEDETGEDETLAATAFEEGWAGTVTYGASLGSVNLRGSLGLVSYDVRASGLRFETVAGAKLGWRNWTATGAVRHISDPDDRTPFGRGTGGTEDGLVASVGVGYSFGPLEASLGYMRADVRGLAEDMPGGAGHDKTTQTLAGVAWTVMKGFALSGQVGRMTYHDEAGFNQRGLALMLGVTLRP